MSFFEFDPSQVAATELAVLKATLGGELVQSFPLKVELRQQLYGLDPTTAYVTTLRFELARVIASESDHIATALLHSYFEMMAAAIPSNYIVRRAVFLETEVGRAYFDAVERQRWQQLQEALTKLLAYLYDLAPADLTEITAARVLAFQLVAGLASEGLTEYQWQQVHEWLVAYYVGLHALLFAVDELADNDSSEA